MLKVMSEKMELSSELDVTNAARGVWLVKVPNYLSDVWKQTGASTELGVMRDTSYVL